MNAISAYEVLGASINDDLDGIQRAYRRRLRDFHPDTTGEEKYEDFLWVKKAFEILRSPGKRRYLGRAYYFPSHLRHPVFTAEPSRINIYA